MKAWTGMDVQIASDRLEGDAATVLGYMLMEFAGLEMELGLFLVWSGGGRQVKELTTKIGGHNFHKRLESLEELAQLTYLDNPLVLGLYTAWLSDTNATRSIRNRLIHGRWGVVPQNELVANVVGLPTAPDHDEVLYSIAELREQVQTIRTLRDRLSTLRNRWPV